MIKIALNQPFWRHKITALFLVFMRYPVLWMWSAFSFFIASFLMFAVALMKFLDVIIFNASKGQAKGKLLGSVVDRILRNEVFERKWRKGVIQTQEESTKEEEEHLARGTAAYGGRSSMEARAAELSKAGRSWFYESDLQQSLGVYLSRTPDLSHDINYYRSLAAQVDDKFITTTSQIKSAAVELFKQYIQDLHLGDSDKEEFTIHILKGNEEKILKNYDNFFADCQQSKLRMEKYQVSVSTETLCQVSSKLKPSDEESKLEGGLVKKSIIDYFPDFIKSDRYKNCKNLEVFGGDFDSRKVADKYINGFVMLLSFFHLRLSAIILEIFDCTESTLRTTMDSNPELTCWTTEEHQNLIFMAIIFSFIYVLGIPLLFLYVLYFKVERPNHRHKREEKARYGYMYQKYTYKCWYWEVVLMFRKLFVKVWTMFTSSDKELLQASGAFFFFLIMWFFHMLLDPYIERELNKLDASALTGHIFVMYAGSMFLTEKLDDALSTTYAIFVIVGNLFIFVYILEFVMVELTESLPMIGTVIDPNFWRQAIIPLVLANAKYIILGSSYRTEFLDALQYFREYLSASDEDKKREELVMRTANTKILGPEGVYWATNWLRESGTSMREGEYYVRWIEAYMHCVDRSTFDQMIQSEWKTFQLSEDEAKFWKVVIAKALRVCSSHSYEGGKSMLLQGDSQDKPLEGFIYYEGKYCSAGTVDFFKVSKADGMSAYAEKVPGSGVFFRCEEVTVQLSGEVLAKIDGEEKEISVDSVTSVRVYCDVEVMDKKGQWWDAKIIKVDSKAGKYYLEDAAGLKSDVPVTRGKLRRSQRCNLRELDMPVGYVWQLHCSQENQHEIIPLSREDRNEMVSVNDELEPKPQLEWFQSRVVTASIAAGGEEEAAWVAIGFANGTIDVWSLDLCEKSHTLVHEKAPRHIYISPSGEYIITFSSDDAVVWQIPEDKENNPMRMHLDKEGRLTTFQQVPSLDDKHVGHDPENPKFLYSYSYDKCEAMVKNTRTYNDREIMAVGCYNDLNQSNVSIIIHKVHGLEMYTLDPLYNFERISPTSRTAISLKNPKLRTTIERVKWIYASEHGHGKEKREIVPTTLLLANKTQIFMLQVNDDIKDGSVHEKLELTMYWDSFPKAKFGSTPHTYLGDNRVVFQGRAIMMQTRAQQKQSDKERHKEQMKEIASFKKEEAVEVFRNNQWLFGKVKRIDVENSQYVIDIYRVLSKIKKEEEGIIERAGTVEINGQETSIGVYKQIELKIGEDEMKMRRRYETNEEVEIRVVNEWLKGKVVAVLPSWAAKEGIGDGSLTPLVNSPKKSQTPLSTKDSEAKKHSKITMYNIMIHPYTKTAHKWQLRRRYDLDEPVRVYVKDSSKKGGLWKYGKITKIREEPEEKYEIATFFRDSKGNNSEESITEIVSFYSQKQLQPKEDIEFERDVKVYLKAGTDDWDEGVIINEKKGLFTVEIAGHKPIVQKPQMFVRREGQGSSGLADIASKFKDQLGTYSIPSWKKTVNPFKLTDKYQTEVEYPTVLKLKKGYPWSDKAFLDCVSQLIVAQCSLGDNIRREWKQFPDISNTAWFKDMMKWLKICSSTDASVQNDFGISDQTFMLMKSRLVAMRSRATERAKARTKLREEYVDHIMKKVKTRVVYEAWLQVQAESFSKENLIVNIPLKVAKEVAKDEKDKAMKEKERKANQEQATITNSARNA